MKKKIILDSKGYTLIEMLAVIVVFIAIGGIIASIFTSSLRGSNKANIENEVRQNGNYALAQMSKAISYARTFGGIKVSEDDDFVASCYVPPPANGDPESSPVEYHYLRILDFDNNETIFSCDSLADLQIASNGASLIDETIVKPTSCSFYCSQTSYFSPPTIKISFILSQAKESSFFEHNASISFETTVVMRNDN